MFLVLDVTDNWLIRLGHCPFTLKKCDQDYDVLVHVHAGLLLIAVPRRQLPPLQTCFRIRIPPSLEGGHRFKKIGKRKRKDMGEVHLNCDRVWIYNSKIRLSPMGNILSKSGANSS